MSAAFDLVQQTNENSWKLKGKIWYYIYHRVEHTFPDSF